MARAVMGSFESWEDARAAEAKLRRAGFREVQVDRISRFPGESSHQYADVGEPRSLVGGRSRDTRVLLNADPSYGGWSASGGMAGGRAFLLTVVVGEDGADQAADIIRAHGGRV